MSTDAVRLGVVRRLPQHLTFGRDHACDHDQCGAPCGDQSYTPELLLVVPPPMKVGHADLVTVREDWRRRPARRQRLHGEAAGVRRPALSGCSSSRPLSPAWSSTILITKDATGSPESLVAHRNSLTLGALMILLMTAASRP